jgi:DNA (cytosine-5)-methyltransferase 1
LSLFSGIGGLDLGLERAGMTVVGQVEIDSFCRSVLARHWPDVPLHDDVRTCVAWWRSEKRPDVDLVSAGFPCQPVSDTGYKLVAGDERWLWPATAIVVRALRPSWLLLENVRGLLHRGFHDVLADLARCGYDAEWDCVPASAFGAPHRRDRLFVVAYPDGQRRDGRPRIFGAAGRSQSSDRGGWPAEPDVGRVAHGVPAAVDRLRSLGNAVVPQVAEHVGRCVLAAAGLLEQ